MKNNTNAQFRSERFKMTSLLTLLILGTTVLSASAQKSAVADALSKQGVDQAILDPNSYKVPEDYAFDLKESTTTAGKTKVIVAKFNPSLPETEQWTVVSVDGKSPSKYDTNTFRKNKAKKESANKTDDASYKIENQSADELVFSYKPDAGAVAKDAEFLKDCRLYVKVNLKTKQPAEQQLRNEKLVKIGPLKADVFQLTTNLTKKDQGNRYFPLNENLNMEAKFLGQAVSVQTVTEYSNYTKK